MLAAAPFRLLQLALTEISDFRDLTSLVWSRPRFLRGGKVRASTVQDLATWNKKRKSNFPPNKYPLIGGGGGEHDGVLKNIKLVVQYGISANLLSVCLHYSLSPFPYVTLLSPLLIYHTDQILVLTKRLPRLLGCMRCPDQLGSVRRGVGLEMGFRCGYLLEFAQH